MASKNQKSIIEQIDFSKLTRHSLLVLRCEEENLSEIMEQLMDPRFIPAAALGRPVLLLRPDESLEVVDEAKMNAAGWYRL